jgi:truncated hemoglobin YjbI
VVVIVWLFTNTDDEWLELLEMNLVEMNVVVYLSRTTGNYGDEWLELLEMNLDEMNVDNIHLI